MGAFTRYLLPIAQFPTAKPWEREDGYFVQGQVSINDEAGLPAMVSTVPTVNTTTYVRGTGQDAQGIWYPSLSYWRYGELPATANNITVAYQAYLGCGMAGPTTRQLKWKVTDGQTLAWESLFTVTNTISNYLLYTYDFGATDPFTLAPWSAALLNACWFGLEAYQDTWYSTFCAANWLLVSYDDAGTAAPRGCGLLV